MAAAHALRTTTTDLYTAKIVSTRPMFLTTGGWIMPIQIKDCDGGISCWETMVFRTRMEAVRWIKAKVRDKFGVDDLTFD